MNTVIFTEDVTLIDFIISLVVGFLKTTLKVKYPIKIRVDNIS